MQQAVHTAVAFGLAAGVVVMIFGGLFSPQILILMDTPPEVLAASVAYLRVYFVGALGMVMYNCCMGIMQAVGDSKHPLEYLIISSVINVVLDIVMIAVFQMGVGGAALATVIAKFISVALCLVRLVRMNESYRVQLPKIRFDRFLLKLIIQYGLPSGLQNSIIGLANVVVQANINAFGEMAMAGCGAYAKIEGFAFLPITSFTQAITTFVGQNLGAREYERTKKGARFGMLCSVILAEIIGVAIFTSAPLLTWAFTAEPDAIWFGAARPVSVRCFIVCWPSSHCIAAVLRGAGRAVVPMVTMMAFWCIVRVGFLAVLIPIFRGIAVVNWVYPLTWSLSSVTLLIYYLKANWLYGFDRQKPKRKLAEAAEE